MIYEIRHESRVTYQAAVAHARFNLRLHPVEWNGQRLISHNLAVFPEPAETVETEGPYVVKTTRLAYSEPLQQLSVESFLQVEIAPTSLPDTTASVAKNLRDALDNRDLSALSPAPYLFGSRLAAPSSDIADWASASVPGDAPVLEAAQEVASAIHRTFAFEPGTTTSDTPPLDAFRARRGVCQDFTHIMIIALRAHGVPAAYVSGYLRTEPPPGRDRLVGADAMHAWVNVWCGPEAGWIGIDPTNDCLARSDHIAVAMGRDFADVSPIDGVFVGSAAQTMTVAVDVTCLQPS